ncbi:methionine ABC transporter ATP-binding protein [Paenibacillus sp. J31TS4]|uniref:ABC transporter ATP-binding protein n=1 Tax=Paenibacillus sp. J31TS4 TaxID=2807195 RepID=UPI001B0836F7|nr:ATP-binding cassette domain-containing protein [Paenibacillus sp. J31TS4]GIP38064.1 methionine ABC transporter ATP-binding protein [Paenibacillus sp. J31TS4]
MIEVKHISKRFRTPLVPEGRFAGVRALFSRKYKEKVAVDDISFCIGQGEFVGYIGPNGAGKSTTIKMLTGILHPSTGEVAIGGRSPHRDRRHVVRGLGVVFGQRTQLWWDLPTRDSYDILAAMYKLRERDKARKLAEMNDLLGLGEFMDTPVRKLSLGQRMRADLAAALLHDPAILFLDEPTIGLDVIAKKNIRGFLKTINRELGKTILLTTHDMDDIEELCQRVMVINHGRLAYDGSIPDLRSRIGLPTVIRVSFREPLPERLETDGAPFSIAGRNGLELTLQCNRQDIPAMDVLRHVSQWGEIADVHMEEPAFEEIIHKVY